MEILKIKTEKRRLGDLGERAAAKYLRTHGYKILERGYVGEDSEIDIICSSRDTVAFVEVKTRSVEAESPMEERPASAVTPEKQRKILKAAAIYRSFNPSDKKMRFDVVEVLVREGKVERINHLIGTFDRDTAYLPPWKRR